MKKAHIAALEKVFSNEIEQAMLPTNRLRFPFQSRAKVFAELAADGLLYQRVVTIKGAMSVTVTGWELTDAGRLAYCETCKDEPEPA